MAESNTQVANLTLGHLGQGKQIGELDTEQSAEARAIRRVWTPALRTVLRDFDWPFAESLEELTLVEEDPNDEWAYAYVYPPDCLKFRRIPSGVRNEARAERIKWKRGRHEGSQVIFTDLEDASGEFTVLIEDVTQWPEDFVLAFSYLLASMVAPQLCGADSKTFRAEAQAGYWMALSNAKGNALDEQELDEEPDPEGIRARD